MTLALRWRRPRSLGGRLLVWLVLLHLVAMAATAWFSYAIYGNVIQNLLDEQMRVVANSYAGHRHAPLLQPVDDEAALQRGALVIQLWSADGSGLMAAPDVRAARSVALQRAVGFSDVRHGQSPANAWRVYTAPAGGADQLRVQVLQSDDYRHHRIVRRALSESLPIALLLPAALLLLGAIVWNVSRSLRAVAREVAAQDERSLAALPLVQVPDEIAPLVEAVNSLLARLRESLATQRRFVQDAAHELRTPITAIALQVENLRAHLPPGEATERFALLESGVARTRHLLEQLLRLSRQEAVGMRSAQAERVDMGALLRESVGQFVAQADQCGADLGYEGHTSAFVAAPAAELRSVFDNLIDNALRHTPRGSTVDVRLHRVDDHAVVDVLDDGPGIAPEWKTRVFDRFFRVPGTAAAGSGLGLAIAQLVAQRHGLRIELRTRDDSGASGLMARVHLPA